jgi:hypothetical protein
MVASQFEMRNGELLTDTDFISEELKLARKDWMDIETNALSLAKEDRAEYLAIKRADHLKKHKKLLDFKRSLIQIARTSLILLNS